MYVGAVTGAAPGPGLDGPPMCSWPTRAAAATAARNSWPLCPSAGLFLPSAMLESAGRFRVG